MIKRYKVSRNGDAEGPYDTTELQVMLDDGGLSATDQVSRAGRDARSTLDQILAGKPSLLEKELSRHQARQAGISARILMAGALVVSCIRDVGAARPAILGLLFFLVTALVTVQLIKGTRGAALVNFVLAWLVTPGLCWAAAWFAGARW